MASSLATNTILLWLLVFILSLWSIRTSLTIQIDAETTKSPLIVIDNEPFLPYCTNPSPRNHLVLQALQHYRPEKILRITLRDGTGLGANIRLRVIPALQMALVLNRRLVVTTRSIDIPLAPILSWNTTTLSNSTVHTLSLSEARHVLRHGKTLERNLSQVEILEVNLKLRPQRQPPGLVQALYKLTGDYIQRLSRAQKIHYRQAHQEILQEESNILNNSTRYSYYGKDSWIFAVLVVHSLRLPLLAEPFSQSTGLMIRATDKCGLESTCLTLPEYLEAANATNVLVSSESKVIRQSAARDLSTIKVLEGDPMQILASQLSTQRVIGNCCSNFHLLLGDFRQACGKTPLQCLQDHERPEFRLKCVW